MAGCCKAGRRTEARRGATLRGDGGAQGPQKIAVWRTRQGGSAPRVTYRGQARMGWRSGEPPEVFPLHLKGPWALPTGTNRNLLSHGRLGGKACRPAPWAALWGQNLPREADTARSPLCCPRWVELAPPRRFGPEASHCHSRHHFIPMRYPGGRYLIPILLQKKLNCRRLTDFRRPWVQEQDPRSSSR